MPASFTLTFHRAENTADPYTFAFEPQVYQRFEGDRPVRGARFPWADKLLDLLGCLERLPATHPSWRHRLAS